MNRQEKQRQLAAHAAREQMLSVSLASQVTDQANVFCKKMQLREYHRTGVIELWRKEWKSPRAAALTKTTAASA